MQTPRRPVVRSWRWAVLLAALGAVWGCSRDSAEAENHQAADTAAGIAGMPEMADTAAGDSAGQGVMVSAEERGRLVGAGGGGGLGIRIAAAGGRGGGRGGRLVGGVPPAETAARTVTTKV